MKVAFILFNEMTVLDLVGAYDPISRLKLLGFVRVLDLETCAMTATVEDCTGLKLVASLIEPDLRQFDLVVVPGGPGTRSLMHDDDFIHWIRTAQGVPLIASVCTGSLILGAAGFLHQKMATTHADAYDLLSPYCKEVVTDRIVDEGNIITAAGVASSIDLGLYLCEKYAGQDAKRQIAEKMEYRLE